MWKARQGERRRPSAAYVVEGDGPGEADDISVSPTTSVRHASASHSSEGERDDDYDDDGHSRTRSPSHDDRASDGKRKPFFSRSLFHPSSTSHSSSSTPPNNSNHHALRPHTPNLAPAMASAFVSKSRRVRFDLTLRIHDLNNVPLVSGTSFVKWHLPSSTAAEHRGRTPKAAIKEHRVVFGYEKMTTVRLVVDKAGMLQESWIQLEVLQEYSAGGRGERITLGHIRLNLAEYVDASAEPVPSPVMTTATNTAAIGAETGPQLDEGGVTRRYLMQDSKINSTLKVGVLMRHVEGTRDYSAPPLRTALVFGGIAGIISSSEPAAMQSTTGLNVKGEGDGNGQEGEAGPPGALTPNLSSRNKEAGEMQDMYRRTLAAFWASQPGELKADECIEDIFAGGDGWGKGGKPANISPSVSGPGVSTPNANGEMTARDGTGGARIGRGIMGMHKRNMSRHRGKGMPLSHNKSAGELDEMDVRDDLTGWRIGEKAYS